MPSSEACPAIEYINGALEDYVTGPMYEQVLLPHGARMYRSIGSPCVDRPAMAAEVAVALGDAAENCEGVCRGGLGCLVLEQSVQLRVRDELSRVQPIPDYE